MSFSIRHLASLLICMQLFHVQAQKATNSVSTFKSELEHAQQYMSSNLIAEAIEHVDKAINYARTSNEKVQATTLKAEILRASSNQEQAFETLHSISSKIVKSADTKYQLSRLGRLAAVHQEYGKYVGLGTADSVIYYIQEALSLADRNPTKYQSEIASLYNELGLYVYRRGKTEEARKYYEIACDMYRAELDSENLVTPLSNLLELESCALREHVANEIEKELNGLIEGKDWYRVKITAYNSLKIHALIKKEETTALRYEIKYLESVYLNLKATNSEKMLLLRQQYEHDKLEQEIETEKLRSEKNANELEEVNKKRRQLFYWLIGAIVVGGGVILLFIRERRMKKKMNELNRSLNTLNERYQLLVVESNHRIKNNLQMISAMLEYTSKGIAPENKKFLNDISLKINTISALHKHLYVDIHNDFIPVSAYFKELIKLYEGIAPSEFSVKIDVGTIQIRSERIVYFGLIFNEMLSNTLAHSPGTIDQIEISIRPLEKGYQFNYIDHSVHLNTSKPGMGSKLIRSLVKRVGGSNFSLDPNTGRYQFDFSVDSSKANAS